VAPTFAAHDLAKPRDDVVDISMARYFTGTRPMNMIKKQVASSNAAVERFVNAINPQITPHQIRIGINDSFISSMFCWRLDNMLARLMMSAKLAKSEG
jgi:hypothetical protein